MLNNFLKGQMQPCLKPNLVTLQLMAGTVQTFFRLDSTMPNHVKEMFSLFTKAIPEAQASTMQRRFNITHFGISSLYRKTANAWQAVMQFNLEKYISDSII